MTPMTEKKEAIWYLKVIQENYSYFQPETRKAIDYAIQYLEKKEVKD